MYTKMLSDQAKQYVILVLLVLILILLIVAVSKKQAEGYAPCGPSSSKSCSVVGSSATCSQCNAAICTPTTGSWGQTNVTVTNNVRRLSCSRS